MYDMDLDLRIFLWGAIIQAPRTFFTPCSPLLVGALLCVRRGLYAVKSRREIRKRNKEEISSDVPITQLLQMLLVESPYCFQAHLAPTEWFIISFYEGTY